MRNNCNKIRFVALVIFMLIGTMNTWAQEVSLSSDMFHDWNYTDRKNVTMTNKDPYITNNIGIVLNRNEVIYGTAGMWSHNYADLTDYDCMRIIGDPNKTVKVQIVFNRKQDYGDDWVNETYTIAANGILEIALPVLLSDYDYYHLNCIRFTDEQVNNGAKIQEVKLYKYEKVDLALNMFHKWNGVGADASYITTNAAGTTYEASRAELNKGNVKRKNGYTYAGTGDVYANVYADLMGYSAIYLEGTPGGIIRLLFNRQMGADGGLDGEYKEIVGTFDSNGKLLIDLKKDPQMKFWHLNAIKNSYYNPAANANTPTVAVSKIQLWKSLEVGFPEKNDDINTQYSLSYEIGNNSQREFTFVNHSANSNTNNYGWALWTTNRERTNDKRKDYFFMSLAPSMQIYDEESGALAEPEESSLYIKNGNDLEPLTDEQLQQFRNDMANGCYVSVKVANYDGIITVYSVMKKNGRVYVYATKYDKYDSSNGAINVFFTVDHALLTNFRAKDAVYTRKVSVGGINYPANTEERYKTCSVAITTLDGYDLPAGTAVGQGDTVTYHAIPGRKWEFVKWGDSNVIENPRNIVLAGANINPYANFQRPANISVFDPATDRVFFENFENLDEPRVAKREIRDDEGNLIRTDVATNKGIETVTKESDMAAYEATPERDNYHYQGKYLNYGGRGRVLNDPVFGKYYQNLADSTDEYTKSVAQNFLRIILTDEQREQIGGGICRYDNVWDHWKDEKDRSATIGFWVNARVANKYELPLERGSMFCMFSNERFRKADAGADDDFEHPRFMFDLACNGTTYANMPNNFSRTGDNNQEIPVQRENFFFYGDTVPLTNTPTPSLFGEKFYKNAQDQTTSKFYDDGDWHYVAYVATNGLKTVTLFVDGEECGTMDMTTLGEGLTDFQEEGDFSGRTFYLRNIVLGGFTPHGLFFQKQYYEDAALAFDEIAIYSRALTADEIYDIIDSKAVSKKEWHFTEALKADGMSGKKLDELDRFRWRSGSSDGVYVLDTQLNKSELEVGSNNTMFSTEGLTFTAAPGQILVDQKNGLIGFMRGAEIYVPNLKKGENVYFVVKSGNPENYPLDPYDLWPVNDPCNLMTRGVSLYGVPGKEDFSVFTGYKNNTVDPYGFRVYRHGTIPAYNYAYVTYPHNNNANKNVLWISDIMISPYSLTYTDDSRKVNSINTKNYTRRVIHVDVERNDDEYEFKQPTLPQLIFTNGTSTKLDITKYTKADFDNGTNPCYIRFSSSAPHIANVNPSGKVTVTGITGYATIKAELVFDNLYDGCISTAYQIRVENTPKTHHVEENVKYDVAEKKTVKAKDGSDAITMSLGGWAYNDNTYAGTEGDVMDGNGSAIDSWSKGFVHNEGNDVTPVDGFSTYSQGNQNAKSESYGNDDGSNDGRFDLKKSIRNVRPWTLPSRGSYLKFDVEKPGVLTVYVLQNGNLEKTDLNQDYSDKIYWRPVYITNERGECLSSVQYDTNSRISENDNFFKEGRRRAQFIKEIEGTYNQRLKDALLEWKRSDSVRFKRLLDHWENQGWKQKVIETGDGGYMIMSKGIVRYSFNVLPGQTYYVFSNDTKLGYAGYNFEEGKQLRDDAQTNYDIKPLNDVSASVSETIVYKDKLQSEYSTSLPAELEKKYCVPIEYERNFTANTWSSICLPFSMNHKQLEENFGEGTSVVMLKKIHNSGALKGKIELIWHVNQDIIAGYPYFILPTKDVTKIEANVNYRKKLEVPYLAVSSNGKSYAHKGTYSYYKDYPYVFEGNFNDEELPTGSYVMSNSGSLTKLKKNVTAKPFRAYIRCFDAANAKPLTFMGIGEPEGETTSIDALLQDNGIILESSDVYGVNGLKVRGNTHSLEGLPKGVYLVKGKKYVVK